MRSFPAPNPTHPCNDQRPRRSLDSWHIKLVRNNKDFSLRTKIISGMALSSIPWLDNIKFVLISPTELRIPDYIREEVLEANNIPYQEVTHMDEVLGGLDILYMTRVQRERFFNEEDYIRLKDTYILDKEKMSIANENMLVLHPLPRVNEISVEVDDDPRAVYFKQVQYGVYVRMALILTLLNIQV